MKIQYFIVALVLLCCLSCRAESNLLLLIPNDVPNKTRLSQEDYKNPLTMKINYAHKEKKISELQITKYPNENSVFLEDYFSKNKDISKKKLISFLNSDENFIIQRNYNSDIDVIVIVESSYKKIKRVRDSVGEFFFYGCCGHENFEVLGSFGYSLKYIENDKIDDFGLGFMISEQEMDIFSSLPEIFTKKNGVWCWKNNRASVTDLYTLMLSRDSRLPKVFVELQDTWEHIISNLEIDGVKVEVR